VARRRRREIPGVSGGLNLTPLLDIIFNLIFFFILATNIREKSQFLDVNVPASGAGEERVEEEEIPEIAITEAGTIYYNEEEVTAEELETRLTRDIQQQGVEDAILSTDADVPFQKFIDVTEIVVRAGIPEPATRLRPRTQE